LRSPSAPYLAVPTTAGTGAEVTANTVLASREHRVKVSMRSPRLLPRVALVDPELALGSPPGVTATSGLDALTQCLEPYVSPYANVLTDGFAREGLRRAAAGLRPAFEDGRSLAARADMALCALLGGLALANAKLGAVHGLAGVIGGMIDAPHGGVCAALLAPVTERNVRALREREPGGVALARYEEVARLLTGRCDAVVEDGVAWIRETVAALDVTGLAAYGLRDDDLDEVIPKAQRASSMRGNPVDLTAEELHAAVIAAL
jgi:alcohol dehydrogenase class IV